MGHPWFPPSPQLILGEDYVTPVLKEQTGRLLEDAYGSGSSLGPYWLTVSACSSKARAVAGTVPALATDPRQAPGSVGTVGHHGSALRAAGPHPGRISGDVL